METITQMPETAEPRKVVADRRDGRATDQTGKSDAEMMYAWSLGATESAEQSGDTLQEECPPEVYIG